MWNGEDIVVFDLVRSSQDHINYEVIEQLKNGRFNSTKYLCEEKAVDHGKHVKMIVFTNEEPDRSKLSPDRWDFMTLQGLTEWDDTEYESRFAKKRRIDAEKAEKHKVFEERQAAIREEIQDQDYMILFNQK